MAQEIQAWTNLHWAQNIIHHQSDWCHVCAVHHGGLHHANSNASRHRYPQLVSVPHSWTLHCSKLSARRCHVTKRCMFPAWNNGTLGLLIACHFNHAGPFLAFSAGTSHRNSSASLSQPSEGCRLVEAQTCCNHAPTPLIIAAIIMNKTMGMVFSRAPVAVGIVLVWAFGYWYLPFFGARHWFKGPPVASEVAAYESFRVTGADAQNADAKHDAA